MARRPRPPPRPLLIIGFDTEYVVGAAQHERNPNGVPGNWLLTYSFYVINQETGREGGGVINLTKNDRRCRLTLEGCLARIIDGALNLELIDHPPERVILASETFFFNNLGFRCCQNTAPTSCLIDADCDDTLACTTDTCAGSRRAAERSSPTPTSPPSNARVIRGKPPHRRAR